MGTTPVDFPLLLPVENQVRELDSKILLACIAAFRGFTSYIGSRREIHFNITAFPQGIYMSKSITGASDIAKQAIAATTKTSIWRPWLPKKKPVPRIA